MDIIQYILNYYWEFKKYPDEKEVSELFGVSIEYVKQQMDLIK